MAGYSLGFAVLESQSAPADTLRTSTLDGAVTPWGPIRIAVDGDDHRHVLIPLEPGAVVRTDKRSAGIQVGRFRLGGEDGVSTVFLDVHCLMPHLNDVFGLIATEIVDRVATDPNRPDQTASQVLDRWRELLARGRTAQPSTEGLTGLYGELWHLRRIVRTAGPDVSVWAGPDQNSHDFVGALWDLEVKTIRRKTGWAVEIHGERQLLPTGDRRLYLAVLKVELVPEGGGESVPDLLDDLCRLGVDRIRLLDCAEKLGLGIEHLESARAIRFEVTDHRAWLVEPPLPCIVPLSFVGGEVPSGVTRLTYQIELASHLDAALTPDMFESVITNLVQT